MTMFADLDHNKNPVSITLIMLSVFSVSLSLFAFQVTLARLYSAILSYHYVFMTTSAATCGLGIGSIWAYKGEARLSKVIGQPSRIAMYVNKWSFILSCGLIAVFVLIYLQPFTDNPVAFALLGAIPFVISGRLYSMLFKALPQASGKLYFADLTGAGAGGILVVFILNNAGMLKSAIIICLLPLVMTFILPAANRRLKAAQYALPILLVASFFMPAQSVKVIESGFYGFFSNTGKEFGVFGNAGLSPEIEFTSWNSFSRTDLIKTDVIPNTKFLLIDGGATAPMYEFDGDIRNLEQFKTDNGFVPFAVGGKDNVLLIGVGGGLDVLYAIAADSKNITAVEINTASIEAVRLFGDFNGHIFDRPEVKVHGGDGRSFVRYTNERFDLIFMSIAVTNTTQGVGFALSENYIYTIEAMEEYLEHLNENGSVVIVVHDQNAINKLTATAVQALVGRGVPLEETPDYIASYFKLTGTADQRTVFDPVIVIKKSPFSAEESMLFDNEISARGAYSAYLPHLNQQGPLLQIKTGQLASLEELIGGFEMNARPATDNNPYFFNFDRKINATLLQILIFSLAGSLLLFAFCAWKKSGVAPPTYFGLLGMGFMMIEIPLIQKFILYLGHPTPAFSYILAALLIGSGMGSFTAGMRGRLPRFGAAVGAKTRAVTEAAELSQHSSGATAQTAEPRPRYGAAEPPPGSGAAELSQHSSGATAQTAEPRPRSGAAAGAATGTPGSPPRFTPYLPPIFAAIVNLLLLLSMSYIFRQTQGLSFAFKVTIASLIAISAGFFMGMPFPRGLAQLGDSGRKDIIPLMWGINGTMSVVGSALSIILSMAFGFSAAIAAGITIYLAVGVFRRI